jgi:hypothetical protein
MAEGPQWGRAGRRARRELSRALAREFMQQGVAKHGPDWPLVVAVAGLALAVFLFVLVRTKLAIVGSLIVALGCLIFIGTHLLTKWKGKSAGEIRIQVGVVVVVSLAIVAGIGVAGWPEPTHRELRGQAKASFRLLIGQYPRKIQVEALVNDYEGNQFADDLVLALFDSMWDVEPRYPVNVLIPGPVRGIEIRYKDPNDVAYEHLENALKKSGFNDVNSFYDPQQKTDMTHIVGTCTSCRL